MLNQRVTPFHQERVDLVTDFSKNEEISRIMPGKKDFLSVVRYRKKEHAQKYLICCNLKETYQKLKETHPDMKIEFSQFAPLSPMECCRSKWISLARLDKRYLNKLEYRREGKRSHRGTTGWALAIPRLLECWYTTDGNHTILYAVHAFQNTQKGSQYMHVRKEPFCLKMHHKWSQIVRISQSPWGERPYSPYMYCTCTCTCAHRKNNQKIRKEPFCLW